MAWLGSKPENSRVLSGTKAQWRMADPLRVNRLPWLDVSALPGVKDSIRHNRGRIKRQG